MAQLDLIFWAILSSPFGCDTVGYDLLGYDTTDLSCLYLMAGIAGNWSILVLICFWALWVSFFTDIFAEIFFKYFDNLLG